MMIWLIIVVLVVALDQATKYLIEKNIEFGSSIPVIDNFFYISHWRNTGAAWGVFQNGRLFLIPLTIVISAVMIYCLLKTDNTMLRLSFSFIIGGAIGNLIDRIWRGWVVAFFEFHFGTFVFPLFNVGDSFVVIGTALLVYYLLFIYKEKEKL